MSLCLNVLKISAKKAPEATVKNHCFGRFFGL